MRFDILALRKKKVIEKNWSKKIDRKKKLVDFRKKIRFFFIEHFEVPEKKIFPKKKISNFFRCQILKINFRHENVIFFTQDFFSWQGMIMYFRFLTTTAIFEQNDDFRGAQSEKSVKLS